MSTPAATITMSMRETDRLKTVRGVVVVAPEGEVILNSEVRVFVTNERQGVNYRTGVWHHPLLALEASCFVVIDRGGQEVNCDELALKAPLEVVLPQGL